MTRALLLITMCVAAVAAADAKANSVVVTNKEIVLAEPVYFDVGKPSIKSESFAILDALVTTLKANKKIAFVEIQAHTDARGNDKFNLEMSQKRADAIHKYLVDKGIAAKRLRAKGYGETQPLDKNSDAKARAKNRRVAFKILQQT